MQNGGKCWEKDSLLAADLGNQFEDKVVIVEFNLSALGHSDVVVDTDLETDVRFLLFVVSPVTVWITYSNGAIVADVLRLIWLHRLENVILVCEFYYLLLIKASNVLLNRFELGV